MGKSNSFFSSTCDSPAARRKIRASEAVDDRDRDGDGPAVSRKVRKAIAGVEARRDIRDEKAVVEAARNKRHPERERRVERWRIPEVGERKTAEAVAAGKTSNEDGNDDSRRREERQRVDAEEERKTTNESSPLRGKRPVEDSRAEREDAQRSRSTPIRWHSEEEAEEPIDEMIGAEGDSDDGDAKDEPWKTTDLLLLLLRLRSTNSQSSFVLQSSRKKIRCNVRRTD